MEIRTIDDNRKIVQECPFCGGLYYGTSGIIRHMKACKKKLCAQCKRPKEMCYDTMKFWSVECGETFEDNPLLSSTVSHWEDEIAAQVIDLARIDVTKDNKQRDRKKKAFIEGFISARLGENFSEYEEKMPHYIIDALEDEKVDTDIIKKIDVNEIASRNKQRIYNYLFSFVELIGLKYDETVKRQIKDKAHKF